MTGATAPAPKMDEVVCAHNFFRRKGTKPILQVTVACKGVSLEHLLRPGAGNCFYRGNLGAGRTSHSCPSALPEQFRQD